MVIRLSVREARELAVRAQLLAAGPPMDLVDVVDALAGVQLEPTAPIAPTADLVLWSRMGASYQPDFLTLALDVEHELIDIGGFVRAATEVDLLRPEMALAPRYASSRAWLEVNATFRRDVLDRLAAEGPLASTEIDDTSTVPWSSTGWTNGRNVMRMLDLLAARGEVAVARHRGRERLFDLGDRVLPRLARDYTAEEAHRIRNERRLRALGILRPRARGSAADQVDVEHLGEEAVVDGVAGVWRVDPSLLDAPFAPRVALLSPFDRLVTDRARLTDLFGFEYVLEMYKPEARRRWGYYALPILVGDRLVGKLDASADRARGVLVVHAVHEDVPFESGTADAVRAEIEALAAWLRLEVELP